MILLITPKEGQDETGKVSLLPNLFYAGSEGKRAAEDVWPPFLQKSSQSREQSPVEAAKSRLLPQGLPPSQRMAGSTSGLPEAVPPKPSPICSKESARPKAAGSKKKAPS